jgi:hypothetical protein
LHYQIPFPHIEKQRQQANVGRVKETGWDCTANSAISKRHSDYGCLVVADVYLHTARKI